MQSADHTLVLEINILYIPNHPIFVLPAAYHVFASAVEVDLYKVIKVFAYAIQLIHGPQ